MKKLFSLLLAVVLVVGVLSTAVSASYLDLSSTAYIQGGTNAYDLQAYGVHTFNAYKVSVAPTLDGLVSTGEYPAASDVATIGNGLSLTNGTGTTDYTAAYGEDYAGFTITTYLAYDNEYAYIAEVVVGDSAISVVTASGEASTLNTSVRYGLNQSKEIPEASSRLSNTYTYNYDGTLVDPFSCSAGNRTYKSLTGLVTETATLDEHPYTDANNVVWNKAQYKQNTAASYSDADGKHSYVFEYKIPLVDVAFSAVGAYKADETAKILNKGTFYGSYLFQVAVTRTGGEDGDMQMFLTTGKAGNGAVYPYSSPGKGTTSTWTKAIKEYWSNAEGGALSVSYVPSPVQHNGAFNPSKPVVNPSSGFRPGMTGFALDEISSVYKLGTVASFTVLPDAIENTNPVVGDSRVVPTEFRLRQGSDAKLTGTFASDHKTAKFQTTGLSAGVYSLVVTFTQQTFNGSEWVNTEITKNLARNITIAGSVMASANNGAAQTGDSVSFFVIAGGALLLTAGAAVVIVSKKKREM